MALRFCQRLRGPPQATRAEPCVIVITVVESHCRVVHHLLLSKMDTAVYTVDFKSRRWGKVATTDRSKTCLTLCLDRFGCC